METEKTRPGRPPSQAKRAADAIKAILEDPARMHRESMEIATVCCHVAIYLQGKCDLRELLDILREMD